MNFSETAELIMNPIRLRLVMALVNRNLTPAQLGELLSDVPQATLYRHLNKLVKGTLVEVAEERQVRGTVEKVYRLNSQAPRFGPDDLREVSKDDWMRYFSNFVMGLLANFSHYLESTEKPDFLADGVGFTEAPIYLNDAEFMQMAKELNEVLLKFVPNPPEPGRRRRLFTTIVIPEVGEGEKETNLQD